MGSKTGPDAEKARKEWIAQYEKDPAGTTYAHLNELYSMFVRLYTLMCVFHPEIKLEEMIRQIEDKLKKQKEGE